MKSQVIPRVMEKTVSMTRGIFLLLLCKPNTIYSGFDTKYALDMYRKSAYNRKYRKRKAKALRLCRRGETEREVKRMIRYIVKRSGDKVSFDGAENQKRHF